MRIYNETAQSYIHALSTTLSKDPKSVEEWRCLFIEGLHIVSYNWFKTIIEELRILHKNVDCDILCVSDNGVLLIGRENATKELHQIAQDLTHAAFDEHHVRAEISEYNLCKHWQSVYKILQSKSSKSADTYHAYPNAQIDNDAGLMELFQANKLTRGTRQPIHIMLVEDDPLTRRLVTNCFKQEHALITANNAQEAVTNYLLHAPDIVFLDIGLPDTNGFHVLCNIINLDKHAYVVMFSGNSYLENITTALSNGAKGFVAKPFRKEKMQHYIESSLHYHKHILGAQEAEPETGTNISNQH